MMKNARSTATPAKKTKAAARPKAAPAKAKSSKRDPRKVTPPTAPASVAAKAVEAIAPVAAVATAEPKNGGASKPAPAIKATAEAAKSLADSAAPGPSVATLDAVTGQFAAAFNLGTDQARSAYARAGAGNENLRKVVSDSTAATTRGLLELNGKFVGLWRAQSDAALDLWRSTLSAGSVADAVKAQTSGFRQSYEATTSHWKDIAETTGRLMGDAAKTFHSALTQTR
jgi:hypothetical protein